MKILGLQKLSLVDYDGHIACTVFLGNCNFACPFCHNSTLVSGEEKEISHDELFDYLKKRKGLLDSVCVSGGEPTIYPDLPQLIKKIKDLGYLVKLDTNGTNPGMIEMLVNTRLIDYIAMDIKNSLDKYSLTAGRDVNTENITKSIKYIMSCGIDYEFRTTLIEEFHDDQDIIKMGELIQGAKKYFLQKFVDSDNCIKSNLNSISKEKACEYKDYLQTKIHNVNLRGY